MTARRSLAALALCLVMTPARSEDPADGIAAVINRQIAAFQAGDAAAAFADASPGIRGLFGTADSFGRMVATGYPDIWDPAGVDFLGLRQEAGRLQQRVRIIGRSGRSQLFDYEMIQTDQGWKINGVRPVAAAAPAV